MEPIKKAAIVIWILIAATSIYFLYSAYRIHTCSETLRAMVAQKKDFETHMREWVTLNEKHKKKKKDIRPTQRLSAGMLERLRRESRISSPIRPRAGRIDAPEYTAEYIDVDIDEVTLRKLAPYIHRIDQRFVGSDVSSLRLSPKVGKDDEYKARFRVISYKLKEK